jgi:DNA-directed RNA polymerase subunit RPC12/RpoP
VKCSCDAVSDLSEYLCGSCGHNGVTDYRIENVTKRKCHYCGEFQR